MFTPARICSALALTCTAVLTFADAGVIPSWGRLILGAVGTFAGGIVSISGPVQKSNPPSGDAQ